MGHGKRFSGWTQRRLLALLALLALLLVEAPVRAQEPTIVQPAETASIAALPAGFGFTEVVSGLRLPVDLVFLPGGEMLIAQKGFYLTPLDPVADIRLVRNGELQAEPVVRLSANLERDSGIFGLAVDPDFATNHYFYVWYAAGPGAPSAPANGATVNRLVRLTLDPDTGGVVAGSYTILLNNVPWTPYHDGGGLHFMPDGTLLISTGDANIGERAQDLSLLNGKLLRIRPTASGYEIPADNPFVNTPGARAEIYAWGLRNPFRFARQASTGRIVVGDVGNQTWEEIDVVQAGANYGWPLREGFCANGELAPCSSNPPQFTTPLAAYLHSGVDFGGAVTGLAFYEGATFPANLQNRLFFADYDQAFLGWIDEEVAPARVVRFASGVGRFVDLEYWREAIYALDIVNGKVLMLAYSSAANQPPVAQISASATFGAAPLLVTLSGADSINSDDPTLLYRWDFGDGTPEVETGSPTISHTYATDKNYTARLTVVDTRGAVSQPATLPITVYSGETPTIALTITGALTRTLFHGGDVVTFAATRSSTSDLDADTPWTWNVLLQHNEHAHPDISDLQAGSGDFTVPADNHGGATTVWYRFVLTMKTQDGISVTVQRDLLPEYTTFAVRNNPDQPGMVLVEDVMTATPATVEAIVGTEWHLKALDELVLNQGIYAFAGWQRAASAAGEPALSVTASQTAATYTMEYTFARPAERIWMTRIQQ